MKNMTFLDLILSYILFLKFYLKGLIRYFRHFKNSFSVMKNVLRNNYPIHAVLNNGTNIVLNGRFEVAAIAAGFKNYSIDGELLVIKNELGTIKLLQGTQNGDPIGVFFEEVYKMFPTKDQTILDIGANIGDSSIYFALKGAKKVIAIEPFPANYELAKKNIELNNLEQIINVDLASCSNKSGFLVVDNKKSGGSISPIPSRDGTKIPLFSLADILKQNNLDSAILKMDCEGCEYDSILNTDDRILKKFSTIIIEYHYGYQNLMEKLKNCGFQVKKTHPIYYSNYHIGYIYATKN
jgi:FkbM family methyltransferase